MDFLCLPLRFGFRLASGLERIPGSPGFTRDTMWQCDFAADIQRAILELPPALDTVPCLREREVRLIAIEPNWINQRKA